VSSFLHHVISCISCKPFNQDDEDIAGRCGSFIGQFNNVLCYFKHLDSNVKYKLFTSYCTSFYGSELWLLANNNIDNILINWRKGLRRIWELPPQTHSYLLPLVSRCRPLFDELCRRSLNFIRSCLNSSYDLIRFVSMHGFLYGRGFSIIGQNVSFCRGRFDCYVKDIIHRPINRVVGDGRHNMLSVSQYGRGGLLRELLDIKSGAVTLAYPLSVDELTCIISYICTE
jgi:hypothetical protein